MTRTVWYPGHMARGLRKLRELAEKLDVMIDVRDARAPMLTGSPFSEQAARLCPVWVVLSKKDIADEEATGRWLSFFRDRGSMAWAADLRKGSVEPISRAAAKMRPPHRELRLAVIGIPNVGKSMLLNALVGKNSAPVGGIPGITRGVSWYRGKGCLVVDSPGIVDPRSHREVHRRLAWLGSTKTDVIGGYEDLAEGLVSFLGRSGMLGRALSGWDLPLEEEEAAATLQRIGIRLGCLVRGGEVNRDLAGRRFIEAFSTGKLGRFTLEEPGDRRAWEDEA